MPGFYPIYEMNTDGSYKLDDNGDRSTISAHTVLPVLWLTELAGYLAFG